MEKYIITIENSLETLSRPEFDEVIFHRIKNSVLQENPSFFKISITSETQPAFTLLPVRRSGFAMLSLAGIDPQNLLESIKNLLDSTYTIHGYTVHESPFLLSKQTWAMGEESPGLILVTLFQKKKGLDTKTFMNTWFGVHSPSAIITHPTINYIRNVVTEELTHDTPPFNSIVEEHFPTDSHLLNPAKMFGGALKMIPNMIKVYREVTRFIDMETIVNFICREHAIVGGLSVNNKELRDDIIVKDRGNILQKV